MSMTRKSSSLPMPSKVLAWEEFVEVTGVTPEHLQELLALGWIETRVSASEVQMFEDADIYRVRKLERICGDFELPVVGGTIIVDLLERIDRLERMVRDLHSLED
ncbi:MULTISPECIES: chaperone modulator CbpM [unclassified Desulfovibrio]|uniref:chaperone modulator CbpM n=1 Tax=unclassified Desulfovibrio TaxID=2593640 RepID=UPI0013EAD0F5|nr:MULTISPECIES: chaperone modulator CbpM [unclassified Desulfovibrio]MBD5627171.1 MerR family transcriptional regulator [Desulfovibrio sp.]